METTWSNWRFAVRAAFRSAYAWCVQACGGVRRRVGEFERGGCGVELRRGVRRGAVAIVGLAALLCVSSVATAETPASEEPDEDEPAPGLTVRFEIPDREPVRRVNGIPSAHGRWSSIDRRLPDDPRVSAVWSGLLKSQTPGPYRLLVYGRGRVELKLRGAVVLDETLDEPRWAATEPLELEFDHHPFEMRYTGTDVGTQIGLFWSGPGFGVEPIAPRQLFHTFDPAVDRDGYLRGETLVRAARCVGCHRVSNETLLPAPALDRLAGMIDRAWLVGRLTSEREAVSAGRMPHFGLPAEEADAIAAFLTAAKHAPPPFRPERDADESGEGAGRGGDGAASKPGSKAPAKAKPRSGPDAAAGERLAWTLGCVACHALDDSHASAPFDGGDLRRAAEKRPREFFERWLADPSSLNIDRRMPEFELSSTEREDLAAYLAGRRGVDRPQGEDAPPPGGPGAAKPEAAPTTNGAGGANGDTDERIARGRELFAARRCNACHRGPGSSGAQPSSRAGALSAESRWEASCLGEPDVRRDRPVYRFDSASAEAVRRFVAGATAVEPPRGRRAPAAVRVLAERNCLACHSRDMAPGLAERLPAVASRLPDLAARLPAMTPPSLTSVGDKLHETALAGAITRLSGVHRPYLDVRMPKFRFASDEVDALIAGFADADRVPDGAPNFESPGGGGAGGAGHGELPSSVIRTAGGRLVTPDGFGCTSCHAVGKVEPPPGPLAARGPNLSNVSKRVRRAWYERWVRNPARIVPRMEMPSVQLPVRGLLDDRLDRQLDVVWQALNLADFEPPEPNPVQVLRRTGVVADREWSAIVTDVVQVDGKAYVKPFLVGLPNRHNVLFDLESNRLVRWSSGDVARQRTKGKSWHWEAAGIDGIKAPVAGSELTVRAGERSFDPQTAGQFPTEIDEWRHLPDGGVELAYRLRFAVDPAAPTRLSVRQSWRPIWPAEPQAVGAGASSPDSQAGGFVRRVAASGAAQEAAVVLRVVSSEAMETGRFTEDRRVFVARGGEYRLELTTPGAAFGQDGGVTLVAGDGTENEPADVAGTRVVEMRYLTPHPVDRFLPPPPVKVEPLRARELDVAPGFQAVRLPLPPDQMPTALAWSADGRMLVASLKGRVWTARDTDGDGWEDQWQALSDELAAPYGLAPVGVKEEQAEGASERGAAVDVATKFAVLRLHDADGDGRAERVENVASGWGHTTDYHDWATGLVSDGDGGYFLGLACQQDKRSPAAAALRGSVVRLIPRTPSVDDPRRFATEVVSGGHRFPMGLVRNRAGDLFVTDNQGNYNPFNELNHVRPGRRYGFINAVEQKPGFQPPVTEPAINLPHPWTRSVNGVALLDRLDRPDDRGPSGDPAAASPGLFGPFTGHLIGCEYDTRRLVRMSLQKTGDTYQGAVYPFSRPVKDPTDDFLGPLCAAVSPAGELVVGGIRDSGWGGGNNVGEIVRMKWNPDSLPAGIAEVRATEHRLEIDFTRPVDRKLATDVGRYAVESYRRVSTPAYGGPDQDRRGETVKGVELSEDGRRATLAFEALRPGFVYELHLKPLVADAPFFPDEAHLTILAP